MGCKGKDVTWVALRLGPWSMVWSVVGRDPWDTGGESLSQMEGGFKGWRIVSQVKPQKSNKNETMEDGSTQELVQGGSRKNKMEGSNLELSRT